MKAPKTLKELLEQNKTSDSLSMYRQKSEFIIQVQRILSDILGDNIAQNVTVSNYKNSSLCFQSHSSAVVTSLKMQKSLLLSRLRSQLDASLSSIDIKVSPKGTHTASKIKQVERSQDNISKTKKNIPNEAADILQDIADSVEGKLKDNILRLIQHKKGN